MKKATQQREGHASTRSLPHHRVTPQSTTSPNHQHVSEQWTSRVLHAFNPLKMRILWAVIVAIVISYYFNPDMVRIIGFLVLITVTQGGLFLLQTIHFLYRVIMIKLSVLFKGQVPDGQPEEEDQNRSA